MTAEQKLILAAASLQRRAGDEWGKFLEGLKDYDVLMAGQVVSAPLELLPTAQGRAQAIRNLTNMMSNCIQMANTLDEKSRGKPNG